ncbi:phage shock protein PspA [Inquilinus sp. CAU 1745]|uniref:phage shock protein PspA n=1 Tax=Inquilinus sp. CAU 1745 TaxID=3140369 RepID=UPI00325B4511
MGVFSRLSDIVNSNLNAMLDRAEDPQKIVRLIIQEMEDTLVEVRSAAARSIAEKKEITRRIEQLETAQAEWQRKAELAIGKGRDDLAKGALVARAKSAETVDLLKKELDTIDEALAKTDVDLTKLQAKLAEAKNKQKSMEIRRKTATDRIRIRTQLHDGRIDEALGRYDHLERKIDDLEGRVESFDLGDRKGPRTLDDEFADLEAEDSVQKELEELKARMSARS